MGSRLKIEYDPRVPRDVRREVTPLVRRYAPRLIPHIRELRVEYEDMDDGGAKIAVRPEYHSARMVLDDEWRDQSDERKEDLIRHELSHGVLHDWFLFSISLIDSYVPDVAQSHTMDTMRFFLEQATDRISAAVAP